jgi:anaerobic selenocysteine-containing dehydrogenase
MADAGLDPLPGWIDPQEVVEYDPASPPRLLASPPPLTLISGAAHHFVTSSMANQASLLEREGTPFVEINPADAAARAITDGDTVVVENSRGWCKFDAPPRLFASRPLASSPPRLTSLLCRTE